MDENVSKGFHLGGTIMATMAVIAIAITAVVLGISIARRGSAEATQMTNDLADQKYTQYDGTIVNGDTVVSLIKQYANSEIGIIVNVESEVNYIHTLDGVSADTEAGTGTATRAESDGELGSLSKARDITSNEYINPNSQFKCVVLRNEATDAIVGLYFNKVNAD